MDVIALYLVVFLLTVLALAIVARLYLLRTESTGKAPLDVDHLLNGFEDPLVALDGNEEVLAANIAFRRLFADDPTGEPLDKVLASYPEVRQAVRDTDEGTVSLETPSGDRHYTLKASTVGGGRRDEQRRIVLFNDVTEYENQCSELERRNERLDEFASIISHDLRNPLDVAIGRTNACRDMTDDPEIEHQLEKAVEAHRRMRTIIDDVLALAREGEDIEELSEVDIQDVGETAWSHVETGDGTLEFETACVLRADPPRLERIFENLFRNAIQHGGDSVTVRVGKLPGEDGFFVADDGDGIPAEERDSVFEAGFADDEGGTGLGLAIVNRIAQAHGWDIEVGESATGGAQFEFHGVEAEGEIEDITQ